MNNAEAQQLDAILKEIRDNQKLQIERQTEALALQREQWALLQRQADRHERIQDRAENIQAKSAQMVAVARRTLFFLLPVLILLMMSVSWLIFR